jgi:hypothetical protein
MVERKRRSVKSGFSLKVVSGEKNGNQMLKLGNGKKKHEKKRKSGEISLGRIRAGENHGINEDLGVGTRNQDLRNIERGLSSSFIVRIGMPSIPKSVTCSKILGCGAGDFTSFYILPIRKKNNERHD